MRFFLFLLVLSLLKANIASALDRDELTQAIERESLNTLEETLAWIETHHPSYLEHFTLMKKSQSLQGATALKPRAIVFGETAELILTFTGDSSQKNGQKIELMQFNQGASPSWQFQEIEFGPERQRPKISEINPSRCAQCHGSHFNPIWSEYDFWPGAYGERDDTILDLQQKYQPILKEKVLQETQASFKSYMTWKGLKKDHPRYKYLKIDPSNPSVVAPFVDYAPVPKHMHDDQT